MKRWWPLIALSVVALVMSAFAVPLAIQAYRVFVGFTTHETKPPGLPVDFRRPAVLIFSKTNRYRHEHSIPAANALVQGIALRRGWSVFATENGAIFNSRDLSRFDVVIWNNVTGDVLTTDQRGAFRAFIENGGGFVGVHGSGDLGADWPWYINQLIGARFLGHPKNPQFQRAHIIVEDRSHPATQMLPAIWIRSDEWYSFDRSVRARGYHVLATLDESTYRPRGWGNSDLRMGADHPIMWRHCEKRGRVFYSALGHKAEAYSEPLMQQSLEGAIAWAARVTGEGCG